MSTLLGFGGRKWANVAVTYAALDSIHAYMPISFVIEGGAHGADSLVRAWAIHRDINNWVEQADWDKHGRSAGIIRNEVMAKMPFDIAVGFPGGKGSLDMLGRCLKKEVLTIIVLHDGSMTKLSA